MRNRLLPCLLTLAACVHAPPVPQHESLVVQGPSDVRPLLQARIAGEAVQLLVDSGAQVHVLRRAFVLQHDLPTDATVPAHGENFLAGLATVNGAEHPRIARDVPVAFASGSAGHLDFWQGNLESHLPAAAAGIVSPQALIDSGSAMSLDLVSRTLSFGPAGPAVQDLRRRFPGALATTDFCRDWGSGTGADLALVEVTIEGLPAALLLDTGATSTALWSQSKAALAPKVPTTLQGPPGVPGGWRRRDGAHLQVAHAAFQLPLYVGDRKLGCEGTDGLLGMDVLQHCAIVWERATVWLGCDRDMGFRPR